MKTLILLTDSESVEQALERLPVLSGLSGTACPGLLRANSEADGSYALMFSQYAKAWGKKYYVWDGSDSQARFPQNLLDMDCLILSLPAERIDFPQVSEALSGLLDGLKEAGESCRLLLLCVPAPLICPPDGFSVDSPDGDSLPDAALAAQADSDAPRLDAGASDEGATPTDESAPEGADLPDPASPDAPDVPNASDAPDVPNPSDTPSAPSAPSAPGSNANESGPSGGTVLPFLLIDPELPADRAGALENAAPIEADTLCRLLFLGVSSEDLETVYPTKEPEKKKESFFESIFDWIEIACFALVGVILLMTFFVRRSPVEGSSMYPTLVGHDADADNNLDPEHGVQSGYDDLLISNLFYTPKRLDIVIIQEPSQLSEPIVKRIIGLSGDRIKLDFNNWEVWVNGVLLDEPYVNKKDYTLSHQLLPIDGDNCWEGVVPEGYIFVLGDNRGVSKDSRTFGFIDQRYIIGKVFFRIGPFSRFGAVGSAE